MTTMNVEQAVAGGIPSPSMRSGAGVGVHPIAATTRNEWSYGRLWARVPGNATYLLAVFVLAMTAIGVLLGMFFAGVGLLVLVIGLPVIVAALFVARGFATADRFILRMTGLPQINEPDWASPAEGVGFWHTLVRPLRNSHYWAALLHGAIVNPLISIVSFSLTVTWLSVSLSSVVFIPGQYNGRWGGFVAEAMPWVFGGMTPIAVEIILRVAVGVLFAGTLPWVLGGLAAMHHAIARVMLGPSRADALAIEVEQLDASRGAAVHAEDAALRRLERDIHDGPQQRLVRLQIDLAALERRLAAGESAQASALAQGARLQAKATLDELRALSSGMAPPLLQDRGLRAALGSLAAMSTVPVRAELDPALDGRVAPGIERSAYFVVAELLANAAKHADASAVTLRVSLRQAVAPSAASTAQQVQPTLLDLWVVDNGRGGAVPVPGHGLEGLRARVQGLRGGLKIDSPVGGSTAVHVWIPLG